MDELKPGNLVELALVYLRLGLTAFGGPAAHIAMMHREFVEVRRWLTREEFLDLLGAVNLIPGPNSTQMAMQIGKARAGNWGLCIAGICFILPAGLIVSAIAWCYVHFGVSPNIRYLMYGIKPVVVAIILQAIWNLARTTLKGVFIGVVGLIAAVLAVIHLPPLAIVFGSGITTASAHWVGGKFTETLRPLFRLFALVAAFVLFAYMLVNHQTGRIPFAVSTLFLYFTKVGAILYGSGYVLLAYLNTDLVFRWKWLSQGQLLDAVAVGQFTPGPVFTTATFIGYILGGPIGAIVATVGIFLPSFFFVGLISRLMPGLRESKLTGSFMDGVNVASLAVLAVVAFELGTSAIGDWLTIALAVVSLGLLIRFRLNSAWLIAGGALLGLGSKLLGV